MVKCRLCGEAIHQGDVCWLCELEEIGGDIYVTLTPNGKIGAWFLPSCSEKPDGDYPVMAVKEFITIVRKQQSKEQ